MPVKISIPITYRRFTQQQSEVTAHGTNLRELLEDMELRYPGIKSALLDENEQIRRYINIYIREEDVRYLQGLDTSIENNSEIFILPAIAGGAILF
jgi:molybdopterin synthase sulfur carrier subunit